MKLSKIKIHNKQKFINDLRSVEKVVTYCSVSHLYAKTTKVEIWKAAETREIHYFLTSDLYVRKQVVMVII